jgi:adenine deaminase
MVIRADWLAAAAGRTAVDLLLKNARLINVFSGTIQDAHVAVHQGHFVGPGAYRARRTVDLNGRYLAPGFIDGHCHLESTMLLPGEFARAVLPHGTTAVVADPHEIANVLGAAGINYLVEQAQGLPFRFYFTLPSCVPATGLETSGAELTADELAEMAQDPWVLGLAEVMNVPGVIHADPAVMKKIDLFRGRVKDGHAPGLSGEALNAYLGAGMRSDHECTTLEEAQEKLERGMWIMIRQGSTAKNLDDLLPLVNERTVRRCMLVTDDRTPEDLVCKGHLDSVVGRAVERGLDPILAIQMVTLNPAEYFGLRDLGAIAPGFRADAVVLEDLYPPRVGAVIVGGSVVYRAGGTVRGLPRRRVPPAPGSFRVPPLSPGNFEIRARNGKVRVIELVPGQIVTRHRLMHPRVLAGRVSSDPDRDLLKIAVVERHRGTGRIGLGLIRGFGLRKGALASSVAHDSHNVIVVGVDDADMLAAARAVIRMEGGLAVAADRRILSKLPLPVGGLISRWPVKRLAERHREVRQAAAALGSPLEDPFMALSFLALPVIPELKLTDLGLVDVQTFQPVELFVD